MQRNFSIDIVKTLAALLVICIHTGYPFVVGDYLVAFCRVAVPLFLLVSGYYYQDVIDKKKITAYYKKILGLTFFSSIFYFIVSDKKLDYLITFRWDKMLIFNFPIAGDHLWYLFSLINVLVILSICCKIRDKLFYLIPFLLIGNYILSFSRSSGYIVIFYLLHCHISYLECIFINIINRFLFYSKRKLWFIFLL